MNRFVVFHLSPSNISMFLFFSLIFIYNCTSVVLILVLKFIDQTTTSSRYVTSRLVSSRIFLDRFQINTVFDIDMSDEDTMSHPLAQDVRSETASVTMTTGHYSWFRQHPYFAAFSQESLLKQIMHHEQEPNNIRQYFK